MSDEQWTCFCNYMNVGNICTKCAHPKPSDRAKSYMENYEPVDQEKHRTMVCQLRDAAIQGKDVFNMIRMAFIMDTSYDRGDMSHVSKAVELEFGWHDG